MKKYLSITIKNEDRKVILEYMTAKANKSFFTRKEAELKPKVQHIFAECGKALKATEKTEYIFGSIQEQGKAKYILHKETIKQGSVDWKKYALSLGGTLEGAEAFRKNEQVSVEIDWATDNQSAEIRGLH